MQRILSEGEGSTHLIPYLSSEGYLTNPFCSNHQAHVISFKLILTSGIAPPSGYYTYERGLFSHMHAHIENAKASGKRMCEYAAVHLQTQHL